MTQFRLRQLRRVLVPVTAGLGQFLGELAVPFLNKGVAVSLGLGDLFD